MRSKINLERKLNTIVIKLKSKIMKIFLKSLLEKSIEDHLNRSGFIWRQIYVTQKDFMDPALHVKPLPDIFRHLVDVVAVVWCLFCGYFVVSFGIYYGQAITYAWLYSFVIAMSTQFIFVDPITILVKAVLLPKLIHRKLEPNYYNMT